VTLAKSTPIDGHQHNIIKPMLNFVLQQQLLLFLIFLMHSDRNLNIVHRFHTGALSAAAGPQHNLFRKSVSYYL
jgi:hypothetical protein